MAKRKYTHVKELLPAIQAMVEQGMTQREIAEHYGFDSKLVVKKLLERSLQKERTVPKTRGRKPAKTLQEYKYENNRINYLSSLIPYLSGMKYLKHKQMVEKYIDVWKERIKQEEIRELLED